MLRRIIHINTLYFCFSITLFCQTNLKSFNGEVRFEKTPLREALEEISKLSGIQIIFDDNLTKDKTTESVVSPSRIQQALKTILTPHSLDFKEFNNSQFVIYKKDITARKYRSAMKERGYHSADSNFALDKPILLSKIDPIYPKYAIDKKIEGQVVLKMLVNREGTVQKSKIDSSSGYSILDSAAINYAHQLKFLPAQYKNKPKTVWVVMVFKYFFLTN
jgi:TonB family protein